MPDADPGHCALPYELSKQCVAYCDARLDDDKLEKAIGLRRDSFMLRILFVHMRRQDELWQMTRASLHDLGPGKGFNWVVPHMKNKQRESSTIPIVKQTDEGIAVGSHLRLFLLVAPPEPQGRLFRHTRNVWGSCERAWEPVEKEVIQRDCFGVGRAVMTLAGFTSKDGREALQRIIEAACPNTDYRLYTGHSLRSGGATAALANHVPITTVKRMLEHKSIDSTLIYTKPTREQVRAGFAAVGSGSGSSSSSNNGSSSGSARPGEV
jgi:integrase